MIERTFDSPVFVRAAKGLIQEINCLEDALEFLYDWPEDRRGTIYDAALRACQRGFKKALPLSTAKNAFIRFAHSEKIFEEVSTALPWIAGPNSPYRGGVPA